MVYKLLFIVPFFKIFILLIFRAQILKKKNEKSHKNVFNFFIVLILKHTYMHKNIYLYL